MNDNHDEMLRDLNVWHAAYHDVSMDEGWSLFECINSTSGPVQVQRIDDMEVLEDDRLAWALVAIKAARGEPHAFHALAILEKYNPDEAAQIHRLMPTR